MAEHLLPHVAACLDQLVPRWTPPASLRTGAAPQDAEDGEASALVEAVRAALQPLLATDSTTQPIDDAMSRAAKAFSEKHPPQQDSQQAAAGTSNMPSASSGQQG